mmetsp:Transcript_36808/g.101255  ORF Transcript_36808/g.101255 Transcript_36808/m.101255 type:complete len:233 (+) Transcript_36808:1419-2117(+)
MAEPDECRQRVRMSHVVREGVDEGCDADGGRDALVKDKVLVRWKEPEKGSQVPIAVHRAIVELHQEVLAHHEYDEGAVQVQSETKELCNWYPCLVLVQERQTVIVIRVHEAARPTPRLDQFLYLGGRIREQLARLLVLIDAQGENRESPQYHNDNFWPLTTYYLELPPHHVSPWIEPRILIQFRFHFLPHPVQGSKPTCGGCQPRLTLEGRNEAQDRAKKGAQRREDREARG